MPEPTGEVPTVQSKPEDDYFSAEASAARLADGTASEVEIAAAESAQAPAPVIEPIGPPPGVDAKDFPMVQPGAPATPMTEHGGYTNLTTPTQAQLAENARRMTEAAGPSQTETEQE